MSPKQPEQPAQLSDQGALFAETVVHSGATDPTMHVSSIQLEPTPGGVFPEQATSRELPDGSELAAAVHDAVVQDHRRKAQMGKHSPLQRDGGYEHVRPGDVLPGFGVVKPGNLRTAQEFAKELQQKRQR